jgi:outer membrane protein assembly factor BamB
MKFEISDKDIRLLKSISNIAGIFTLVVALTMIFSLIQLKTINPLDNPALLQIKAQYDSDPTNAKNAEQVRAMDLMARKAYFSSRWQVEAGSYLLLAGAVIFILSQRLIAGKEKIQPVFSTEKPDMMIRNERSRKYLFSAAAVIFITAVGASFFLRAGLPDPGGDSATEKSAGKFVKAPEPDKSNFPFFRGQNSHGIAGGSGYSTEWNGAEGKNIEWKTEIPKAGQNSPVIWDDKIFLSGAEDKTCEVYCIDKKSGEILWTASASNIPGEPAELPQMDTDNGLSTSTMAVNDDYACAVFSNGNLICLDHDGKTVWSKNIGTPSNIYGYSSSLLIYDKLLILQFDSDEKIALLGIDIESGETKWETPRKGRPVWSSPVLAYFSGKPQIVINGNPNVSAYDVVTGQELWSIECMSGDVAPSVAVNSNMAYAVTDYAKLVAIKPGAATNIVWEDNTYTPDVSSPVATEEFLFLTTGNGDVACYNAEKGDTLWTHYFMDQFYASPVIADEKLYLLARSGTMHILSAGPEYKLISEATLGERADCTPAFSDKKIYIRGKKNLYCISAN